MPAESDLVYLYDGTFDGFLCCVYESVYSRQVPADIQPEADAQPSLYQPCAVATDAGHAARVAASIPAKIGPEAEELVRDVFCTCLEHKELALLRFLLLGYRCKNVCRMLGHPLVAPLLAAQQHLKHEAHLLTGFIRFTDTGAGLAAEIGPKNFVLPYLAPHFIGRFGGEQFLIYDRTHKAALVWREKRADILALDDLALPPLTAEERQYRALWRRFVKTIAVEERVNPRCQMGHMAKRYWPYMLEWHAPGPEEASGPAALPWERSIL